MMLATLLSAAIETGLGLIAEVGFGDAIRDLKERLTDATERTRRDRFERALAQARKAVDDAVLMPLLEHRPFQEALVNALLDPVQGFNVQSAADVWQDHLPEHALTLRRFFAALEQALTADDTWGPILDRFQQQRFRRDVQQALAARHLDLSPSAVVQRVSAELTGSGAMAMTGGIAAGAGGVAVAGDVGQVVLQQIIMQSGARADSANLRQRYRARLRDRCCSLPLAALGGDLDHKTVTLEQVYIELNTTMNVPANVLERIRQGEFATWSAVGTQLRTETRVPLGEDEPTGLPPGEEAEDSLPLPALDAMRLSPRMALLGDPGAGKSTVARIVIARLIDGHPPPGVSDDLLPVLVVLRDLTPLLVKVDLSGLPTARHEDALADAVRDQMLTDLAGLDSSGFAEELLDTLNDHRCLLVFDGLDEVPQECRELVRQAVIASVKRYQPPRVIVTCRTRSYTGEALLPDFHAFTLAPLSGEQIDTFAHAWYQAQKALGRVDAVQAAHKADDLAQAALSPDLRELAANPMLLTTMALIHQSDVGLPKERVRLYSRAVDLLLHRWQREKVGQDALPDVLRDDRRLREVIERLAYEAHQARQESRDEPGADLPRHQAQDILAECLGDVRQARELLDYVDQRAGLLMGRGGAPHRPAAYTFPHRTFQEYLAGCYLLTGSDSDRVREFYARAAEGDRWSLVVQLGAEELRYNTRNGARQLLHLAYNLLAHDDLTSQKMQRAALWSGQMALLAGRESIERDASGPHGGAAYLQRLVRHMVALLASDLPAPERHQAGLVLGHLGDPRFRAEARFLADEPLLGFVEIPEGPFWMGSDGERDPEALGRELPQHEVILPRYFISRYPVTVAQFRAFAEASSYQPEDEDCLRGVPNHPVVNVTWYETLRYCDWLTEQLRTWEGTPEPLATLLRNHGWHVTLPSEAEWEKAARGTDGRIYPWGHEPDPNQANYDKSGIHTTSAVGCFPGGASPSGCLDMAGNVWEWTRSLWGEDWGEPAFKYPYDPSDGREHLDAPENTRRVVRGGAFGNSRRSVRCAYRRRLSPDGRDWDIGCRVVVCPSL